MTGINRLSTGGSGDRGKPLNFTFNGKCLTGLEGDSLASALLANGVSVTARSFKYHRPRGIISCGHDEPGTLVELTGDQGSANQPRTGREAPRGAVRGFRQLLAVPRIRRRGADAAPGTAPSGRLLLQDVHLARLADLRAADPEAGRAGPCTRHCAHRPQVRNPEPPLRCACRRGRPGGAVGGGRIGAGRCGCPARPQGNPARGAA